MDTVRQGGSVACDRTRGRPGCGRYPCAGGPVLPARGLPALPRQRAGGEVAAAPRGLGLLALPASATAQKHPATGFVAVWTEPRNWSSSLCLVHQTWVSGGLSWRTCCAVQTSVCLARGGQPGWAGLCLASASLRSLFVFCATQRRTQIGDSYAPGRDNWEMSELPNYLTSCRLYRPFLAVVAARLPS